MDEYIERETIKAAMIHYGFKSPDMTVTEFVEDELTAADVAPIQHGRWIGVDYDKCSVCGGLELGRTNYCPNCGARMDGAE